MSKPGERAREEILTILRKCGQHCTAYDILNDMRKSNPKIAPTTVYRGLEVLINRGLVHRLESVNAYVACNGSDHSHAPILSICDDCGTVEEQVSSEVHDRLATILKQKGFAASRQVVEVRGTCSECVSAEVEL